MRWSLWHRLWREQCLADVGSKASPRCVQLPLMLDCILPQLMMAEDPRLVTFCGHDKEISWKSEMNLPGTKALPILREYFLSLPDEVYSSRRPAQEYLASTDAPREAQDKDARIDIMASDRAGWIIAHTGQGYAFSLNIPAGTYASAWIDPQTGKKSGAGQVKGGDSVRFEPPSGGDISKDWVLELQGN